MARQEGKEGSFKARRVIAMPLRRRHEELLADLQRCKSEEVLSEIPAGCRVHQLTQHRCQVPQLVRHQRGAAIPGLPNPLDSQQVPSALSTTKPPDAWGRIV